MRVKKASSNNKKFKYKSRKFRIFNYSTTVSSSIIAEVELEKLKNIQHRFFPYDVSFLVKKFLILWKPDRIFLVDPRDMA